MSAPRDREREKKKRPIDREGGGKGVGAIKAVDPSSKKPRVEHITRVQLLL
jgi:hypothetical protein